MTKAVTAIEVDLDHCTEVYGRGPCFAAREGDFIPDLSYVFRDTVAGFAGSNATFVAGADAATYTQTGADPILRTPAGLSIVGATSPIIRIDVERTADRSSGSWQGDIFYTNGGHGETGSFFQNFNEPLLNDRVTLEIDMSSLAAGTTDWITGTTTQVRFDFDSAGSGTFKIYSIQFGHYATADEATGDHKCFNALGTCQFLAAFNNSPQTMRFIKANDHNPSGADAIEAHPLLVDVSYTSAVISLGKDLCTRASVEARLRDVTHGDTGVGGDPYPESRDYVAKETGTFFGRFRPRHRYLRGRDFRLLQGSTSIPLAAYDTRHFVMESFQGPSKAGEYSIVAKDLLKLLDGDRSQCPAASPGSLSGALTATERFITLSPVGSGASYTSGGWLNIGGSEVAEYQKDPLLGNNTNCLLLLHCDGSDASTTFTDSSSHARTVTPNGNVQLDTAQKVFGDTSALFDGTDDYLTVPDDAAWAFGTGNFTVDCRANFDTLAAQRTIFCQQTDANNRMQLFVTTAGAISFTVTSASATIITLTSSNGVIAADTWYHIALVRNGTSFVIYVNGVSVATATDSDSIPNYTGAFTIGMQGTTTNPMLGWIDEFRVMAEAFWTAAFTVPSAPYMETDDDLFLNNRGQYNTEPSDHDAGERCQLCYRANAVDPADLVYDWAVNYGMVPSARINLSDWQTETDAYYGQLLSGLVTEPTPVKTLISEVIEQVGLAIWWDVVDRTIRLRVLREIPTDAQVFDESTNIIRNTVRVTEQPDKRITQCWVYFGQFNPLKSITDKDNYRSIQIIGDLDEEENWGQPAIKKIYSRWIAFGGGTIASRVGYIQIGRFRIPPRSFEFQLPRNGSLTPEMGAGGRLLASILQTDEGKPDNVPIQIVSINPDDRFYGIKAEEQLFTDLDPTVDDGINYVTYDADSYNIDLLSSYTSIYGAPVKGDRAVFIINQNIIIGSTSTATSAITTGSWPTEAATGNRTSGSPILSSLNVDPIAAEWAVGMFVRGTGIPNGAKILTIDSTSQITLDQNASSGAATSTALTIYTVPVELRVLGRIQGKGGAGGQGGTTFSVGGSLEDGRPGLAGGLALTATSAIDLTLSSGDGEIWGGGGGGGGGSTAYFNLGAGGGGGAGFDPGAGGLDGGDEGNPNVVSPPGSPGTTEAGGAGGIPVYSGTPQPAWPGGDGGGPGLAGQAGDSYGGNFTGGAAGAAGGAISGVAFCKKAGTGDIRGSET